ncbi:hypothetical protein [Catenulispora sp. GAS73]|uniref:hypothetical protein n=1 Tax=Catenulispora sp. GAS73 TaxID=3156269 RepID=UPI0035198EC3
MWLDSFSDRAAGQDGFSFDVEYHVAVQGADAGSLDKQRNACATVRAIAEPALARCDVLRPWAAEQDVNLHLSSSLSRRGVGAVVAGARIVVRVDGETADVAGRLANARQVAKVDAVERERLRARMAFLEREVIRDKAALRLYLLAEEIEQGRQIPDRHIEELESLADEVRQWSPANAWVATAKILHDYFDRLHPRHVETLVSTLRDSIRDHDNLDLLDRFDTVHGPRA